MERGHVSSHERELFGDMIGRIERFVQADLGHARLLSTINHEALGTGALHDAHCNRSCIVPKIGRRAPESWEGLEL